MNIDWTKINRVLVVRLRSIGDAVLATPSLIALRRFLPEARIDVLLEDWVAPVLDGFDVVDNVLTVSHKGKKSRIETALQLRKNKYDVAFNLHGGTTATFFVSASGALHRVGFQNYQYNFFYNHLLSSSSNFWQKEHTHSAEQQLALLGFVGVPVFDKPKSRLTVTKAAQNSIEDKLTKSNIQHPTSNIALFHPTAALASKQWSTENFARVAEYLFEKGLETVVVATKKERIVLENLKQISRTPIVIFDDLSLPEITALSSKAKIFVGNDSGIAHIAAAVKTPTVVIFGSSNINHWRPWTNAPNEIVYENAECIKRISVKNVIAAIEKVLPSEISVDEAVLKS